VIDHEQRRKSHRLRDGQSVTRITALCGVARVTRSWTCAVTDVVVTFELTEAELAASED
jgi:hypothetical protein